MLHKFPNKIYFSSNNIFFDFSVYTLIKILKFDTYISFNILFGVYKICSIEFKCVLDLILINLIKIY